MQGLSNSYVDKYWGKRTYYVGEINMTLDEKLRYGIKMIKKIKMVHQT